MDVDLRKEEEYKNLFGDIIWQGLQALNANYVERKNKN